MKIYCLTGFTGAGKTTLLDSIGLSAKISIIKVGDISRNFLTRNSIEINHFNLQSTTKYLVGIYNDDFIKLAFENLSIQDNSTIFIDSVRREVDLKKIYEHFGLYPKTIAVKCSDETIKRRLFERNKTGDPRNDIDFAEMRKFEIAWGVGELLEKADFAITNESTKENLLISFEEFFESDK